MGGDAHVDEHTLSFLSFQVHHALTRDAGPLVVCETSSAGAEKTTFLAPASRYVCTSLVVRNVPLDLHTCSAQRSANGIAAGSLV